MILNAVSAWTGEPKFTLNRVLRALTERCAEFDLRLEANPPASKSPPIWQLWHLTIV